MRRFLITLIISLLIPSNPLAATQNLGFVPAKVDVLINGQQIPIAEKTININGVIMLPLRDIAESLGITVKWKNRVILKKGNQELNIPMDSKEILYDRKIFFMEQAPILVNGHTMVSIRFIAAVLGADVTWDENHSTVNIVDNGNYAKLPSAKNDTEKNEDNYYKWYYVIAGPCSGPGPEDAKEYVLKQGLLIEVNDIQSTYIRFTDLGDSVTMVSGIDKDNQKKIVWLSKDQYVGDISVSGTALKNSGLSKEMVISILQEKGINEASIIKLYIAPYEKDKIVWFVYAEQDDKQYYYCIDFFTGATFIENIFKNDVSF